MVAQAEPEHDEAEIVLLAGHAGEEGARPGTAIPTPRKAEQAPAQDLGGEVLLGDGRLAALPAIAELP